MLDVLAQSQRYETIYRAAVEVREAGPEDLKILDEAIDCQKRFIAGTPNNPEMNTRLDALQKLRQDAVAAPVFKESREAENQAIVWEQKRDYVKARGQMREAIDLQERINAEFPKSRYNDVNRVSQLKRMMQVYIARPILEESQNAERDAKLAKEKNDWTQTLANSRKAAELQRQLNVSYVQLRFADIGRTQRLDAEIASLESVELYNAINTLVQNGEKMLAEKHYREAAEQFQNAYQTQQELNRTYPQSRFAVAQRLDELQAKKQTAQSAPLADDILHAMENVRANLCARDVAKATAALETLQPKVISFKESFPRSELIGGELTFEVQFLHQKRMDIARLQKTIYENLIPLASGARMYRTEIPQSIFTEIAGINPSKHRGGNLPVETVNYSEALDFCKRASYLLGIPVRLPAESEFREALGTLRYADLDALSWNSDNAKNGRTQIIGTKKANAAGFHDLLGNVGEWTFAEGDGKNALVMGGNILTPADRMGEIPAAMFARGERYRLNGFRIVVGAPSQKETPANK